jgi:tRNA1(Val) A37 N6-methylase TrmN6
MSTREQSNGIVVRLSPAGEIITVDTTPVFPITPYTRFLLSNLPPVESRDVLDFGAGCGAIGIGAAKCGAASVLCCDVSSEALALTARNAARNHVSQLETLLVFQALEDESIPSDCADVILCNPASLPAPVDIGSFSTGGYLGDRMILSLIDVAATALRSTGVLRFVHTSLAPLSSSLARLSAYRFSAAVTELCRIPFRPHYGPLMDHFLSLRNQGRIAFDGDSLDSAYEYLYLVTARRAPETQSEDE